LLGVLLAACATPSRNVLMSTSPAGRVDHQGSTLHSPIVELRQYTLHPGRRDDLIHLFDAEFIEPQEQVGIKVIGQFRNLDDPNKFVWIRGFPDMTVRGSGLTQFYSSNAWRSRRNDANATIIDNDNVLLLRPVRPDAAFDLGGRKRPPIGTMSSPNGLVVATIYHIDPTVEKERSFVQFFDSVVAPVFRAAGAPVIAEFIPERSANNFPGLPVREREPVFVWFSRFGSVEAYDRFQATLASIPSWRDSLSAELSSRVREPYTLRLTPTARSLLR
jgi:hypothetical protein